MKLLRRARRDFAPPSDFIDVRELIAELSDAELLASADAYFQGMNADSEQCRKPFGNPSDAVHQCRGLGLLFEAANLFPHADVLDFGCATGWLTLALADMGCRAVGVDISPAAIALANRAHERRGAGASGSVRFASYDGSRLPLPDACMDRILCFDAFHHVRDQALVLREFARVLRPGGRIAMLEPGPFHSRTPQSQAEMRMHRVIENDVDIGLVARAAADAGLSEPRMLVQIPRPLQLPVGEFESWAREGIPLAGRALLTSSVSAGLLDGQCFFIQKGVERADSRRREGLAAELVLIHFDARTGNECFHATLRLRVTNAGSAAWLVGEGAAAGTVKVGVQLRRAGGELQADFVRIALPGMQLHPRESCEVSATFDVPLGVEVLEIDMVSELVAWMGLQGACIPLRLPLCQPAAGSS